jgi:hypothetical protein
VTIRQIVSCGAERFMQRSNSPGLLKIWGANAATAVSHYLSLIAHCRNFICVLLGFVLTFPSSSLALTNGLPLTPPMGWNSWNHFGCNVSDAMIRSIADSMANNGMKAAGYQFINIDDCWPLGSSHQE